MAKNNTHTHKKSILARIQYFNIAVIVNKTHTHTHTHIHTHLGSHRLQVPLDNHAVQASGEETARAE